MCGIIGFYGDNMTFSNDKKNFILEGLFIDSLRGQESTGVARLPRKAKEHPEIFKRALSGPDFVQSKQTQRLVGKINESHGFLGHNRSSTRGQIEDENAHPFQYDHITLIHNGTVTNSDRLTNLKCGADNPVDSAQVAWSFSVVEPDDLLPIMKGPFSLVWWDSRDATLHFARNTEKPMYWCVGPTDDIMYFGSELKMVSWLLDRNHLKVKPQAMFTAPGKHYVFKNPRNVEDYVVYPFVGPSSTKGSRKKENAWQEARERTRPNQPIPALNLLPNPTSKVPPHTEIPAISQTTQTPTTKTTSANILDSASVAEISKESPKSLSKFYTKNGKKHPAESELINRGLVGTILAALDHKNSKKRTREEAANFSFEPFRSIIAEKTCWRKYEDGEGLGWMFLKKGNANIQVFNISMGLWVKIHDLPKIPVTVIGIRGAYQEPAETPVFIGSIDVVLVERMAQKAAERNADAWGEGKYQVVENQDKDTDETIEIGGLHTRYVSLAEFNSLVENGCFNCDHTIIPADSPHIGWFGPEENWPLCKDCNSKPMIKSEMEKMSVEPSIIDANKVH